MPSHTNLSLVGVRLSPEENTIIDRIDISKNFGQTNYYGNSLNEVKSLISGTVLSIGENTPLVSETVVSVVCRHIDWMLERHDADYFWLAMRASLISSTYDVPRWHRDGKYFDSEQKVYKIVQSLQGAQSRFAEIKNEKAFSRLEQMQIEGDESLKIRKTIGETVREIFPGQTNRQAIEFLVGHPEAVVHSEPPIHSSRLFYSVMVGSKEQISFLKGG